MTVSDDYVVVGRIGRAHGIRGEVSVEPLTDEPERRFTDGAVLDTRSPSGAVGTLRIEGVRWHQGRLLIRFAEYADRTAAEAARGTRLTCPVDPLESPEDPEEFYDHQLVGLAVVSPSGDRLGVLARIEHGTGQDLLVIDRPGGEVLFPFVTALVPEVDVAGGRIVVDDVPGLLAESDADPIGDSS